MSLTSTIKFICSHPLNCDQPVQAVARFARWQVASRLLRSQEFVFPWVNGSKFRVRNGQTGLTGNIYTGLHEFEEMAFLLHFLRPADLFVDIGANVGSYTILAGAAVGSRCIAFEPVPATFASLVENVRLNHIESSAECVNVAVGDKDGTITFTSDADTVNHVVANNERTSAAVDVPVRTLDAVLEGRRPALLKIDVEGYETPAIAGGRGTLAGDDPMAVIMELNGSGDRYGFNEGSLLQTMFGQGFGAFRYHPMTRSLEQLSAKNALAGNTIFVRGLESVAARLRDAPRFHVSGRQI